MTKYILTVMVLVSVCMARAGALSTADLFAELKKSNPLLYSEIILLIGKSKVVKEDLQDRTSVFVPRGAELRELCYQAAVSLDFLTSDVLKSYPQIASGAGFIGAIKGPPSRVLFKSNAFGIIVYEKTGENGESKDWSCNPTTNIEPKNSDYRITIFQGHPFIEITSNARHLASEDFRLKLVYLVDFSTEDGSVVESREIRIADDKDGKEGTDPDPENKTLQWDRAKPEFHFSENTK